MNRKYAFIILLFSALQFFLAPETLLAQSTADQKVIDLIRTADDVKGKKAGALIILKQYDITLNEKGENSIVLRIVGKIYDNRALNDYSHIPLGFNSYYEDAFLDFARVIRNDGSISEVKKDAVQYKTSPDFSEDTRYSDTKFLTFALSGLEAGSSFEYQVRFIQKKSIMDGEWFDHFYFGGLLQKLSPPYIPRIDPVQASEIKLSVPEGLPITYYLTSSHALPIKMSKKKEDIYIWTLTDLPGIAIESSMPAISSMSPVLSVTTLNNWTQIDQWAWEKLFSGIEITDAIKNNAAEIAVNGTREEKIKSVLKYIHDNIRYTYADIERGGFTPHPLQEIINSRYGDCKDQSILFISLLKCMGIEALPVLVNTYPQEQLIDVPAPHFEHLITLIPGEKDSIWLDITSKNTPYPALPAVDKKRIAFIVNGNGGKLTKTPGFNTDPAKVIFAHKIAFEGSDAINSITMDASGTVSESLNSLFVSADNDKLKEFFRNLIADHMNNAVLDSIAFQPVNDQRRNFSSQIYFHLDTIWSKTDDSFTFGSLASFPLALFAGLDSRTLPDKRENDIIPLFPYRILSTETYFPPEKSMLPVAIPSDDSLKNEFFTFKRTFKNFKSFAEVKWEFNMSDTPVPAGKYNEYAAGIKKIEDVASWNITYVDPVAFAFKMSNENPFAVMKECNDILKNDKENTFAMLFKALSFNRIGMQDSAIKMYRKILLKDPENKYAHFWIASPLFNKRLNAEAYNHLETAIKLDPGFIEPYLFMGSSYAKEKQDEKAMATFKKATAANPGSAIAWQSLAVLAVQKARYKESIDYIKNAMSLDSANTDLYSMLAECYMNLKSYKNALEAYKTAISISPDKGVLYGNLAWVYYLLNDDNKCIEYSKKAIGSDPTLYFAKFNLALASLRSGNTSEAFRLYDELRKERNRIPATQLIGGIQDLDDLVSKGIRVHEANKVIDSFNKNQSVYK